MTEDKSVPVSELEELAETWERSRGQGGPWFRHCSRDLRELMEQHKD